MPELLCFKCGLEIDESQPWYQKEVTLWDKKNGECYEADFHENCFLEKIVN